MPKTFYTERDIEDMVRQGVRSMVVDENSVLTDLAYARARELGMALLSENDKPPAAPERPYIAKKMSPKAAVARTIAPVRSATPSLPPSNKDDLHQRIHAAVVAKLGGAVDAKLLDVIITRVLRNITTK
ncbi:MAG: hypothetical protein L3J16_02605 [Anaerolineales bacterium]|nr:hypothetical protein [Anaerolineales bacterium]